MWSYNETSASSVAGTSSLSASGRTTNSGTIAIGTTNSVFSESRTSTSSHSGVFISGQSSSTYRNPTATTQTLVTTYASLTSELMSEDEGSVTGYNVFSEQTLLTTKIVSTSIVGATRSLLIQSQTLVSYQNTPPNTTTQSNRFTISNESTVSGGTVFITRRTTTSSVLLPTRTTTSTSEVITQSLWIESFTYNSSTSSLTSTANGQTTSTTTRSSTYVSSATSSSTTGTSTITYSTTATASSADTVATSATTTKSVTLTTYATGTLKLPCIVNTVVALDTNEWGWAITTSGSDRVESVGTTFTKSTFAATMEINPVTGSTLSVTGVSTFTYNVTTYTSRTTVSTQSSSATSTYSVAQSGTAIPFTNTTRTATISFTRTSAVGLVWSSSSTRTSTFTYFSTKTASFTDVVPTTYSNGTSLSSVTYTRETTAFAFTVGQSVPTRTSAITVSSATATITYLRDSSISSGPPTVKAITIGEGWQAQNLGRLQAVGTNIGSGTDSAISAVATIWPVSVRTPVVASSDAANLAGSVPTTLTNNKTTTRVGGYGWDSTAGSTASQTTGIHRITTCNGSSSGITNVTWSPTSSTLAMTTGEAIAAESVPVANTVSSTNGDSQFLSFSAFPST